MDSPTFVFAAYRFTPDRVNSTNPQTFCRKHFSRRIPKKYITGWMTMRGIRLVPLRLAALLSGGGGAQLTLVTIDRRKGTQTSHDNSMLIVSGHSGPTQLC
ncbi:hypothetical protein J6590_013837 [Homalodisca vitripennis]|nr:hypothetical protein J6590_013837 [Homalodisca vitripennis]